jgi:hypothetical protein
MLSIWTVNTISRENIPRPKKQSCPSLCTLHLKGHLGRHVGRRGLERQRTESAVVPARRDGERALPVRHPPSGTSNTRFAPAAHTVRIRRQACSGASSAAAAYSSDPQSATGEMMAE